MLLFACKLPLVAPCSRQQGVIFKQTKAHYNGGHFGIGYIALQKVLIKEQTPRIQPNKTIDNIEISEIIENMATVSLWDIQDSPVYEEECSSLCFLFLFFDWGSSVMLLSVCFLFFFFFLVFLLCYISTKNLISDIKDKLSNVAMMQDVSSTVTKYKISYVITSFFITVFYIDIWLIIAQ